MLHLLAIVPFVSIHGFHKVVLHPGPNLRNGVHFRQWQWTGTSNIREFNEMYDRK